MHASWNWEVWRNDRLVAGEYEGGYDLMLLVMSSATVSLLLMTL